MSRLLSVAILLFLGSAAVLPAAAPKKSAPKKTATTVKKTSGASQKKAGSTRRTAASRKSSPSKKGAVRASSRSWRQTQQTPSQDRYREIQQALKEKGFLKIEPNGVWGAESVQALREFQKANNLNETGRIDSLSLFALGLGPKRTAVLKPPEQENKPSEP